MIKKVSLLSLLIAVFSVPFAYSAQVKIEWKNPDKYTDIRPAEETRSSFRARVFRNLEKHFAKLAEKLPESETLKITVTNLDLAGDIRFTSGREFRLVRNVDIPRINFNYQLLDKLDQVIKSDDVKLKDMAFMDRSRLKYRSDSLGYEKAMLDKWFFQQSGLLTAGTKEK